MKRRRWYEHRCAARSEREQEGKAGKVMVSKLADKCDSVKCEERMTGVKGKGESCAQT